MIHNLVEYVRSLREHKIAMESIGIFTLELLLYRLLGWQQKQKVRISKKSLIN